MKVALLGGPGSGKTKIAKRVVARLNRQGPFTPPPSPIPGKQWKVVDGYVDKLRTRTGRTYGAESGIRDNLQVLAERWTLEDEAAHKGHHSMTCGSIYETTIYGAVESMVIPLLDSEQAIYEETNVARTFMSMMGILERRFFDYDALFYLPMGTQVDEEHSWDSVIDSKLPEILEGFFRYAVPLVGTDKQKVDYATDIISNILVALQDDNGEGVRAPGDGGS